MIRWCHETLFLTQSNIRFYVNACSPVAPVRILALCGMRVSVPVSDNAIHLNPMFPEAQSRLLCWTITV